jgi:hypothetical protein
LPQQVVRSSGRIPKEIPILLMGSDLSGKVFSEPTKTVVLSLHGAGILSRHKLSPEQELVLRWPERNKETDIRIVGHIGTQAGQHTYGVAFFDPDLNFWETDFPSVSPLEAQLGLISISCTVCKSVEKIDDASIEADVCATNDGVIRNCKHCGTSTLWKSSSNATPQQSSPANTSQLSLFASSPASAAAPSQKSNSSPNPSPAHAPAPPHPPPASPPSFYASARELPQSWTASEPAANPSRPDVVEVEEPRGVVLTLPPPEKSAATSANRRKHPRVKVNYSACVRHPERGDEIVQCEDMSKGGLRFKSHKPYYAQSLIEVAVPYQPGQPAIFVPGKIVFVEELPELRLYRCGVQYIKSAKPRDSF